MFVSAVLRGRRSARSQKIFGHLSGCYQLQAGVNGLADYELRLK